MPGGLRTDHFPYSIEKIHRSNHIYIRPGHCNANADVESSHELIESEFFDLTRFRSREDFFKKVASYRLFFNTGIKNFYKGIKTPTEICASDFGKNITYNFLLIKTLDLDKISTLTHQRGQSLPSFADRQMFEEIAVQFAPFDLAAIPIGAYDPEWFMHPFHINPEEAILLHHILQSRRSIPIHWGTFCLSFEPITEPVERIKGVKDFEPIAIGETLIG